MTELTLIRGGCLCGAVTFEVTPPTKWCAHCHCTMCRRAHGAAVVTWFGAPSQNFRLVSGAELKWHRSSAGARRGFCGRCFCNRNEGDRPVYHPYRSNDINWCAGASSQIYHCSTALVIGLAEESQPEK